MAEKDRRWAERIRLRQWERLHSYRELSGREEEGSGRLHMAHWGAGWAGESQEVAADMAGAGARLLHLEEVDRQTPADCLVGAHPGGHSALPSSGRRAVYIVLRLAAELNSSAAQK